MDPDFWLQHMSVSRYYSEQRERLLGRKATPVDLLNILNTYSRLRGRSRSETTVLAGVGVGAGTVKILLIPTPSWGGRILQRQTMIWAER